ncbi:hypothetical protein NPIL_502061 [Nephila pilipes]|uniref:Uncharacterized protein n=1 Tax=Nephila pilipes TaxID=299642 RepID=A0A8X6TUI0_NEPPI|nr:hypothetical protein NPIL_502061 [Nephila pilipes]
MRSLPPAYIYAFPKYDPLRCATIKKTTPTTLECHKMTLTRVIAVPSMMLVLSGAAWYGNEIFTSRAVSPPA